MSGTASGPEPEDRESGQSEVDWEQFQREAEEYVRRPSARSAEAPKEPSARARMVTERLRAQEQRRAAAGRGRIPGWGRRKQRPQPEPWQPEGWWTGPERRRMQHGGRSWRWVGVVAALAALVGAVTWVDHEGWLRADPAGAPAAQGSPLPAETVTPSGAPATQVFPDQPTREDPWAGSPARRWAEGADAIELPEAVRTGQVPAARVAQTLELTKRFLVASNLDRDVLAGGRPDEALALLDPLGRERLSAVKESLAHPTEENDPSFTFTRFDPEVAQVLDIPVKVRGRMTVEADKRGTALIHADYTFVYVLARPGGGDELTRTVVRRELTAEAVPDARWEVTDGKLWLSDHLVDIANDDCAPGRFLRPQFPSERFGSGTTPSGPEQDPYNRSRSLRERLDDNEPECGSASRV